LEEQVEVLRRLWAEPVVTFHGRFHDIERAGILPRPAAPIPIWFGGGAGPMLQRAARLGDGFIFGHAGERARDVIGVVRDALVERGRSVDEFGFEGLLDWSIGAERVRASRVHGRRPAAPTCRCARSTPPPISWGSDRSVSPRSTTGEWVGQLSGSPGWGSRTGSRRPTPSAGCHGPAHPRGP